jgi:hypothetical protein
MCDYLQCVNMCCLGIITKTIIIIIIIIIIIYTD